MISCVDEARNSSKKLVNYICFANGDVCLMESTYKDQTTVITAKVRKPWIDTEKYADINSMEVEYELPVNKTLTANIYVNFDKDVQRTTSLTGVTPAATNLELRRPICDPVELGQRGKYVCLELTNAEDLGGDLKINEANLWVKPRARKGKISAD